MAIEFEGNTIDTTATGYLTDINDWSENLGVYIAEDEGIEMTDRHWDVVKYLRSEFIENGGNQPNTRNMNKDMGKIWGEKISSKELFDLFPGGPSKQAGRIGGLPESRRKGGY
ncbi:MAG: TusE/DsrC/DsvC family sulfur relay protein [Gammaproteobacteria bacterium]|nr:TusE/DsrC/DsvC family sulfur relay protein [Gammaproteobacteria bacterium]